jgi:hypothetical protein
LLIDLPGLVRQAGNLLLDEQLPPSPAIGLRNGIQPGFFKELRPAIGLISGRHLQRFCHRQLV